MILCDTNIFIEVYRDNDYIVEILKEIEQQNIAISDVSCAELFYGARNKNELKNIKKDIENLIVLPINSMVSKLAVKLVAEYSLSHKLSLPDALIAATAIENDVELYTLNLKDFRFINGLKLFE